MKHKNVFLNLVFIALFCFILGSCANSDFTKINLNSDWEYSLKNPFTEQAEFKPVSSKELKNLNTLVPDGYGIIYLKKRFGLPKALRGKELSAYLGRITLADKTYLNGTLIGQEGKFPPNEFSAWNTARLYKIPKELLTFGDNTLIIEIFVNGEGSIVSNPFIAEDMYAKSACSRERFWNSQANLLFGFLMLIVAFYHLMVFISRPQDKENLFFALINFVTSAYMAVFFIGEFPNWTDGNISFLLFQKIFSNSLPFLIPLLITSFINSFLKRKDRLFILLIRIGLVILPVIAIFTAPDYIHLRAMRIWTQALIIPPIVYAIFLAVQGLIQHKKDALPLVLGFSPCVITVVFDIITHNLLKLYNIPYLSSFGWQLVIVALLFILAVRFANARKEAEYLNKNLELEVSLRTKELSAANSQLSLAVETAENANIALQEQRQRAEEDMALAAYVQQNFFTKFAPTSEDWDIAFEFMPASGVSGNLYDFFVENKKLNGLALFEVSGKGISSALITMLAKTIIDRNFSSREDIHLRKIMDGINAEITKEKGAVDNFLTGILLRTFDNKVEVINAGEPYIYYRNSSTGKCLPVKVKDQDLDEENLKLGISGNEPDFKVIGFKLNKGDSLILFTKSFINAKNAEGTVFGKERVERIFSESGSSFARTKLDYIMKEFYKFTNGVQIDDDITVIVLQKK